MSIGCVLLSEIFLKIQTNKLLKCSICHIHNFWSPYLRNTFLEGRHSTAYKLKSNFVHHSIRGELKKKSVE